MGWMTDKYILDENGVPRQEPDLIKWAKWFENHGDRRVAETTVGEVWISTVFLGIDHNFSGEGPPILWETMTFRGDRTKKKTVTIMGKKLTTADGKWEQQDRCSGSREQAEAMHASMVERVQAVEALSVT
jgi:hypothetical protein